MNKKFLVGVSIVVIIITAAFGYWYYRASYNRSRAGAIERASDSARDINEKAAQGVLPEIDPNSNPMEKAPDANPISKTNPFSGIKTNPFE